MIDSKSSWDNFLNYCNIWKTNVIFISKHFKSVWYNILRTLDKLCSLPWLTRYLVNWKPTRCHFKRCIATVWQAASWMTLSSGRSVCKPLRLSSELGWMFRNSGLSWRRSVQFWKFQGNDLDSLWEGHSDTHRIGKFSSKLSF